MNIDKLKYNISINNDETSTEEIDLIYSAEENWHGLNSSTKIRKEIVKTVGKKRGKYLIVCPDITLMHNRPLRKRKKYLYPKWFNVVTN